MGITQGQNLIRGKHAAGTQDEITIGNGSTSNGEYNVTDFTDFNATLVAAIEALKSAGGKITILAGTYTLTSDFYLEKDSVLIEGIGNTTIINTDGFSLVVANKYDGGDLSYTTIRNAQIITDPNSGGLRLGAYVYDNYPLDYATHYWTMDQETLTVVSPYSGVYQDQIGSLNLTSANYGSDDNDEESPINPNTTAIPNRTCLSQEILGHTASNSIKLTSAAIASGIFDPTNDWTLEAWTKLDRHNYTAGTKNVFSFKENSGADNTVISIVFDTSGDTLDFYIWDASATPTGVLIASIAATTVFNGAYASFNAWRLAGKSMYLAVHYSYVSPTEGRYKIKVAYEGESAIREIYNQIEIPHSVPLTDLTFIFGADGGTGATAYKGTVSDIAIYDFDVTYDNITSDVSQAVNTSILSNTFEESAANGIDAEIISESGTLALGNFINTTTNNL